MNEHIELLDHLPSTMRRPLTLIDGISYAATWLPVQVTCKEKTEDGKTKDVTRNERRLFILRDDGKLFDREGNLFNKTEEDEQLGVEIYLPAIPPPMKLLECYLVSSYSSHQPYS